MKNELKVVLDIPWAHDNGFGTLRNKVATNPETSYSRIPLIYNALNLRCDGLVKIPVYVYSTAQKDKLLDKYEFEDSIPLDRLIWLSEAALLLRGESFILKNKNRFTDYIGNKSIKRLQWLNPLTMQVEYDAGKLSFYQELFTGERYPKIGKWTEDDILYSKLFNPYDDTRGLAPAQVALGDANIVGSVTRFLGDYFTADALPVTMLIAGANANKGDLEKIENWFKDKLTKLKSMAARVIGVRGDVKIERLTSELNSFDFAGVDNHAIQDVSWAFGIPKTLLTSDSANRATAETEYASFINNTLLPRCKFFESYLNPLLEEFEQRIEFCPEEMPEMQADEVERASALQSLVNATVPLKAALDILGYDISEESMAIIDESIDKKEATLPIPPFTPPTIPDITKQPLKGELDKWLRKAISSFKIGKPASVEFETEIIPDELKSEINTKLMAAKSEEEIKKAFSINGHDKRIEYFVKYP